MSLHAPELGTGSPPRTRVTAPVPQGSTRLSPLDAELWAMSGGNVARADPAGPVFRLRRRRRPTASRTFVRALNRSDRRAVTVLSVGWAASFIWFWTWWLSPGHSAGWSGLVLNSSLLLYLTVTPAYFLIAALRLRRVDPRLSVPRLRVAFVVTRAPSEPWAVVRPTLEAMLRQDLPLRYDVWLCDESPDDGILAWCREHGVRVSCREGVPEYHRATWPRRTRCKEGNLAYFYDHWGYRDYDVVAQLDCDHVPGRGYLTAVVRPFADAAVGYVAAPSVCDANSGVSWAARGRLHREATTHGPLQMGLNGGLGPVCIGSHYAVRTAALREIGGLGPELAEDFSTTFLLTSAGWHGAFTIDAEAHGDGPLTFADMLTQEFQWSRSLTVLLYELMPHHLHRLDLKLRLRFGYALAYYPLLALTTVVGLTLPPVAAVTGVPWVDVNYFVFLAHVSLLPIWFLLLTGLLKRRGLLRPPSAPILSWEGALFTLTRWPYVVWGISAGIMQIAGRRTTTFKVTPKVRDGLERMSVRLVAPYLAITAVMAVAAIAGQASTTAAGYVFLCILAGLGYGGVTVAVCALHIVESARTARVSIVDAIPTAIRPLLAGLVALAPLSFAVVQYPSFAARAFGW